MRKILFASLLLMLGCSNSEKKVPEFQTSYMISIVAEAGNTVDYVALKLSKSGKAELYKFKVTSSPATHREDLSSSCAPFDLDVIESRIEFPSESAYYNEVGFLIADESVDPAFSPLTGNKITFIPVDDQFFQSLVQADTSVDIARCDTEL